MNSVEKAIVEMFIFEYFVTPESGFWGSFSEYISLQWELLHVYMLGIARL